MQNLKPGSPGSPNSKWNTHPLMIVSSTRSWSLEILTTSNWSSYPLVNQSGQAHPSAVFHSATPLLLQSENVTDTHIGGSRIGLSSDAWTGRNLVDDRRSTHNPSVVGSIPPALLTSLTNECKECSLRVL